MGAADVAPQGAVDAVRARRRPLHANRGTFTGKRKLVMVEANLLKDVHLTNVGRASAVVLGLPRHGRPCRR